MNEVKTREVTLSEYEELQRKSKAPIPILKAEATVEIRDGDGELKSTLNFSSEEIDDATTDSSS